MWQYVEYHDILCLCQQKCFSGCKHLVALQTFENVFATLVASHATFNHVKTVHNRYNGKPNQRCALRKLKKEVALALSSWSSYSFIYFLKISNKISLSHAFWQYVHRAVVLIIPPLHTKSGQCELQPTEIQITVS